jgi:hypothetical protein
MVTDDDAITKPAQRVEVFTGTGRRRAWLHEEKARIVAEIASSGDSVFQVPVATPHAGAKNKDSGRQHLCRGEGYCRRLVIEVQ